LNGFKLTRKVTAGLNNLSFSQLEAQFVFTGTTRHTEKSFQSYLQYLEYLNQNRPAPNSYELFAKGYEDYLQSPLQVRTCPSG